MDSFFYRNLKRQYPLVQSAKGVWVNDANGRQYLDGCSGAIVANLGHGLPEINAAVAEQMSRVAFAHTSQFVSEPALRLAEQLIAMAPAAFQNGGRVYFASGGSEAVETALKMARGYFFEQGQVSRQYFISRWNSYHGSTFGAMSVTGHPARRRPYLHMLKDQPHIGPAYPYRCACGVAGSCQSEACGQRAALELESLILKLGAENVAAFIAEPVVGAALGSACAWPGYWTQIRAICDRYNVLLIADEVMSGLGRCGANFALDLYGVEPDLIVVGKGLAAGYLPLSAVVASSRVVSAYENGSGVFEHGFTYSGHPASCAAGSAALAYLTEHKLVHAVAAGEKRLFAGLRRLEKFDIVGDVRGQGYLAGIELVQDKRSKKPFPAALKVWQQVMQAALDEGLLVYPGSGFLDGLQGDHVMVAPPFVISEAEMEDLFNRLERALAAVMKNVTAMT